MVKRIGGPGRKSNIIDPTGPGALQYFEDRADEILVRNKHNERAEFLAKSRMREDKNKAHYAAVFSANIGLAIKYFLDREGNFRDACEILAAHMGEREFQIVAKEKYGLTGDPLNIESTGSAS